MPIDSPGASAAVAAAAPTPTQLRQLVEDGIFMHGETCFSEGAVRALRGRANGGVEARVDGTRAYRVRLRLDDGALDYDCSCPLGQDGDFCPHAVAVGLAWHAGAAGQPMAAVPDRDVADMRSYLLGLDKAALIDLLIDQARHDGHLHGRLATAAGVKGIDH